MIASPAALDVRDLRVAYGRNEVIRRVSLTIGQGEIFGLLGRNGVGKTTLVRAICGRLDPISGAVNIAGRSGRRARERIGLVPQEIALYTHLTVRENLLLFGRLSGLGADDTIASVDEIAMATGLRPRLADRIATLSGGWKRRVNLAAALLHRPALLILDEPMAGIDLDARLTLEAMIQTLQRSGLGILLITHDLPQAEALCSRVGFLQNGAIGLQGRPEALLDSAFGQKYEMMVEFRDMVPNEHRQALERMGFRRIRDERLWSIIADDPSTTLPTELRNAGISPTEMRFRKPGLDTLFRGLSDPSLPQMNGVAP
ncbi:ABC transporter ATP-binding protein [Rhizobium sp. YIM 134829]|uniref:ABC transporter ATP-binding protein n=1 Tax=Rhizobium sp. YIM 134829 TaxID=3390453 RepID=UPI0039783690